MICYGSVYDLLIEPKCHQLTTTFSDGRFAKKQTIFRTSQIMRAISKQEQGSNIYISKYSKDGVVATVILDFDAEDNKDDAWRDVYTCYKYLKTKGMKSFIVDSTNKGFHLYISIPPTCFNVVDDGSRLFKHYVAHLIGELPYPTLDAINTEAGLRGNIRLIGSKHPKTDKRVCICHGTPLNVLDDDSANKYYQKCYKYHDVIFKNALYLYDKEAEERRLKREELNIPSVPTGEINPLDYDLREIMKQIFNSKIGSQNSKEMWISCPFHGEDRHPSMVVTENYYYCKSCGERGNAWSLIKKGYWKPFKQAETFVIGGE